MIILEIMRLSVRSITLNFSLLVEVGRIFLNFLICSNRVNVCSESSIVRSDVYFFVQDSTIPFHRSDAARFQYSCVENLTAKFKFIRGDVIATVCLTTQTLHVHTYELFFEEARLSLIVLFLFYATCWEEEICYSISSEAIGTVIWFSTSAIPLSFQVWYNLPVFFPQKQDTANLCPFPTLRTCFHHRIWWRSCSTAPTFAVLSFEEWRTRQGLALCVRSVLWRVQLCTMNYSRDLALRKFTVNSRLCFFVTEVLRYSASASVHNLIAIGAVS